MKKSPQKQLLGLAVLGWSLVAVAATPAPETVTGIQPDTTQTAPVGAVPGSVIPVEQQPTAQAPAKDAEPSLDQQLEALSVPSNQALPGLTEEKLYSVQTRYVPLRHRHEISIGGGKNFNTDSFVSSNNLDLGYRFYLSDRWYLNLNGSVVFNDWSPGAERLINENGTKNSTLADVAFARYRTDLMAGYHLFYGKFRLSMDQVFYFDQYVAIGPGYVDMHLNKSFAAVGEIGFAFWFGRSLALRVGLKDYFVKEVTQKKTGWAHNLIGALQVGYVFGG